MRYLWAIYFLATHISIVIFKAEVESAVAAEDESFVVPACSGMDGMVLPAAAAAAEYSAVAVECSAVDAGMEQPSVDYAHRGLLLPMAFSSAALT
jgi:hypothetical protein